MSADSLLLARRRFLIAATAALTIPATRGFAADRIKVGKAITSSFPFSGLELAQQQGIWAGSQPE